MYATRYYTFNTEYKIYRISDSEKLCYGRTPILMKQLHFGDFHKFIMYNDF